MKRKYCHTRKNFSVERLQHICSLDVRKAQRDSDYSNLIKNLVEIEDACGNTHIVSSNDIETISKIRDAFGIKGE